jgi:hypothetical protein
MTARSGALGCWSDLQVGKAVRVSGSPAAARARAECTAYRSKSLTTGNDRCRSAVLHRDSALTGDQPSSSSTNTHPTHRCRVARGGDEVEECTSVHDECKWIAFCLEMARWMLDGAGMARDLGRRDLVRRGNRDSETGDRGASEGG